MSGGHIIGLCGYAGAGKDSAADVLVRHAGFERMGWADTLRAEVAEAYGVSVADLIHRSTKETPAQCFSLLRGPHPFRAAVVLAQGHQDSFGDITSFLDAPRSPREIMQWWGTEYRRAEDPNYWTRQVLARIRGRRQQGQARFVLTDCRFANEVETLRAMGGQLWQVVRPQAAPECPHASATDGSQFAPAAVIDNSGDLDRLRERVLGEFWALDAGLDGVRVEIAT